jgi:Transposase protein
MSAAASAILDGMPSPRDLRRLDTGGETVIFAGSVQLFRFAEDDTAMRHIAAAGLRQLGFAGKDVAAVLGLTPGYVATLRQRALREGTAALVRPAGRPRETGEDAWEQARAWRARGVRDAEIARRLGVNQSTVLRRLGQAHVQDPLSQDGPEPRSPEPVPEPDTEEKPQLTAPEPREQPEPPQPQAVAEPAGPVLSGFVPGDDGQPAWAVRSRYAGAMLLHAFAARAGAGDVFAAAAGQDAAAGDVALLAAASACFALGAATTEAFKHLAAAEAGPLAGLVTLPGLRTVRTRLSAIADRADPLELQRMFAAAMLAADPVVSDVYYVDDHFVPYTGAKPVGKGWNNKRGRAERGRADTHVTAHDGRAVCYVTGDPSGLSVTLPRALAELKKAVAGDTRIMLGFDRGGAYPAVFTHCREQNVHWVTYRRAPLAVPAMLPVITAVTVGGKRRQITWAEEKVQVKDYGEARQLTLSEHGRVVLQVLTSDFDACPADILSWLKSRWREENFLKYASGNYGIDKICDYAATIEVNTKIIDNPARKAANAAIRDARNEVTAAQSALAALLSDPDTTAAAKNKAIPAASRAITAAKKKLKDAAATRDQIPVKLRADQIDPGDRVAVLRAGRRGLQLVLRLLAHNAEHWLATHLNAYLRDDDEYRAVTRQSIIRGTAGVIGFTPEAITVTLEPPGDPRVARALALLTGEINAQPPSIPGDTRPITYRITPQPPI